MSEIQVKNLHKSYGDIEALKDISFEVDKSEIFGVIGPDGAGKTSLFRILTSLLLPDSGSVMLAGLDVVKDYDKIRKIIGYMPGRFSLYQDLSVEENLNFYATVFGSSIEENYDLIRDIYVQIEPFKKRLAGKLSGGMKQKLALSCALIHRPEVLVLDEPTTGVDAVSRVEFWDLLHKIKLEGITIIVSTPYMDEAARCDRVALIQKGEIMSISKPEAIHKGFTRILYELSPGHGAYRLLKNIRNEEWCANAWLFGQSVHLTLDTNKEETEFLEYAKREKLSSKKITAGIEDTFMELMRKA
ncbi:MAG: ABC transporter ATP-binding protein [Bacteroidales bacterium]|nr:ABC transporter ATP-binding protein [Bacteroidales bacterium]MCB8998870.1 ABC transporter ATP-binding protein [Bacteroidales bacterium]MCB9013991.1 ABC transporter ATP-binding protein [Bacteroidales bacterium]